VHDGDARRAADGDAGERAPEPAVGHGLCDGESDPDAGVGEGHDGGDDGQPLDLMEAGDLREDDLGGPERDHVRHAGAPARVVVAPGVEAVGPPDGLHADGRGDGVADGDGGEVGVLDDAAEGDLPAAEDGADGLHVRVVPAAARARGVGVVAAAAGAVALGEQRGGVVRGAAEDEQDRGPRGPAELRHRPGEREHAGADHGGDDVRAGCEDRARAAWAAVVVELGRVLRQVACLQRDLGRFDLYHGGETGW